MALCQETCPSVQTRGLVQPATGGSTTYSHNECQAELLACWRWNQHLVVWPACGWCFLVMLYQARSICYVSDGPATCCIQMCTSAYGHGVCNYCGCLSDRTSIEYCCCLLGRWWLPSRSSRQTSRSRPSSSTSLVSAVHGVATLHALAA